MKKFNKSFSYEVAPNDWERKPMRDEFLECLEDDDDNDFPVTNWNLMDESGRVVASVGDNDLWITGR